MKKITIALLLAFIIGMPFIPLSSADAEYDALIDYGNGRTQWSVGSGSTLADAIASAFPDVIIDIDADIVVNGIGTRTIGTTDTGGTFVTPGATGVTVTSKWSFFLWDGTSWNVASPTDPCTGPFALAYYPVGTAPIENPSVKSTWIMTRGDSANSSTTNVNFTTDTPATVEWSKHGSAYASMLNVGDIVFIKFGTDNTGRATVLSIDSTTGNEIWSFSYPSIANYELSSPVIVGDNIYIPSANGYIFKFDWKLGPGLLDTETGVYSNAVYMTDAENKSVKPYSDNDVNEGTGMIPWQTVPRTGGAFSAGNNSLIYDSGVIYLGNSNGMVYAMDLSMNLIWSYQTNGCIYFNTPTIHNDYLFIGALDGSLHVLDRNTGVEITSKIVYQKDYHGKMYGCVDAITAIDDGTDVLLFFAVSDGRGMNPLIGGVAIYRFDGTNLNEVILNIDDVGLAGHYFVPIYSEKSVYFMSSEGLVKMDQFGHYKVLNDSLGKITASLTFVNGEYLYAMSYAPNKPVFVLDLEGKIISTYTGHTGISQYSMNPVLVLGDRVIVGTDGGACSIYGVFSDYVPPSTDVTPWYDSLAKYCGVIAGILAIGYVVGFLVFKEKRPYTRLIKGMKSYVCADTEYYSTKNRHRLKVMLLIGGSLSAIIFIACLCIGPTAIYGPGEALSALISAIKKGGEHLTVIEVNIYSSRLPRTLVAFAVGIGLSVAGVIYQAIIRNPLVDPYIMGVSAGAGTAAVAVIGFNFTLFGILAGNTFTTAIVAMVGGVFAFAITMIIAEKAGGTSINYVLAGVVVGLVFSAIQSIMLSVGTERVSSALTWLFGSFANIDWPEVPVVFSPVLFMSFIPLLWVKGFNLILLGEDQAKQMGLNVVRFNRTMLILASLLASLCVAFVGIIGFVGLVVPHLCRMVLGGDHRLVIPSSIAFGGFLMMTADLASRMIIPGLELPVGAITTIVGVPVFAWLLVKKGRLYDG